MIKRRVTGVLTAYESRGGFTTASLGVTTSELTPCTCTRTVLDSVTYETPRLSTYVADTVLLMIVPAGVAARPGRAASAIRPRLTAASAGTNLRSTITLPNVAS